MSRVNENLNSRKKINLCRLLAKSVMAFLVISSVICSVVLPCSLVRAEDDTDIHESNPVKSADPATWSIGGTTYPNLSSALSAASSGKVIVLASDGVLEAGEYTIPNGVTLLIPMDSANTVPTATSAFVSGEGSWTEPSSYRTLTMEDGAHIIVGSGGSLNVASKYSGLGQSGGYNGTPTGPHGTIIMNSGSNITVQNNGELLSFGYISGPNRTSGVNDGTVTVLSGGVVRETFQIIDWRGGTATTNIQGNSNGVFPFSQYFVQNIEVPLTMNSGATEYVYSGVYMGGSGFTFSDIKFISNSGALFNVTSGSITRTYHSADDTVHYDINGNMNISSITLKVGSGCYAVNINSNDYVLPICNNINIHIHAGTTTINQDAALLAGCVVDVDKNSTLTIANNHRAYIYDSTEWNSGYWVFSDVTYQTLHYTQATRGTRPELADAAININGTVSLSGKMYTTAGGANITSSQKTGKVMFVTAAGTETNTYQVTQDGSGNPTYNPIAITSIKLHNGSQYEGTNEEYTLTGSAVADDQYLYCEGHDRWSKNPIVITFDPNGGEGASITQTCCTTGENLQINTFTKTGCDFAGWNTKADGSGVSYADGEEVIFNQATTLYAQWTTGHVHNYQEEWTWTGSDTTGYTAATVLLTCQSNPEHTETLNATITTTSIAATCTTGGNVTYTATAVDSMNNTHSDTKIVNIPATGHTPVIDPAVDPTCTETGLTEGSHCSVCGKVLVAQQEVPALGHL
nr:InlB B-repeat-containing protein [Erysipelotrichaceae bacterium]